MTKTRKKSDIERYPQSDKRYPYKLITKIILSRDRMIFY